MVSPFGSTASSAPVDTSIVRGPVAALAAGLIRIVTVVAFTTVTLLSLMKGPTCTCVVPCTKWVLAPVKVTKVVCARNTCGLLAETTTGALAGKRALRDRPDNSFRCRNLP
jgi:hypothetical protein